MQLFTPRTIVLLAATSSLMTLAVSAKRATTCILRLSDYHLLSCDEGVIIVNAASFDNTDVALCGEGMINQLATTRCSQHVLDTVRTRCNGKKECQLHIRDVGKPHSCEFWMLSTFKYLDTNYTCLPAIRLVECEHSLAHLYCDEGLVISVYGADYGRRDYTTCPDRLQPSNSLCYGSTTKVAQKCNGKNSCTIRAHNSVFGDPCRKYLELAYVCQYPTAVPNGH